MSPFVRPLGVGDLKVIKQKLVRYEAGEIAHVENVMGTESRTRQHRRLQQEEVTTVATSEREEENLRDLQSTERFELQNEVQKTIKEDTSIKAGVDLSATMGPVSLATYLKFDYTLSKQESDRLASNYAKDVMQRSLNRLVEKTSTSRTDRTLDETEEINFHGFTNPTTSSVSGIYRWLDKFYRCKVVDYGKRLFYEFAIPEPAAFYIFARKFKLDHFVLPEKPDVPTAPLLTTPLQPTEVSAANYQLLAGKYAAEGIEPPPADYVRLSKALTREIKDVVFTYSDSDLKIPGGYVSDHFNLTGNAWGVGGAALQIFAAAQAYDIVTGFISSPPPGLLRVTGSIPVSVIGANVTAVAFNLGVTCQRTAEAYQSWQLKTYGAIMTAYNKALSDYEDKLVALQVQQGVAIGGNNPEINRTIELRELKRSCITVWTGEQYVDPSPVSSGIPTANPPANFPAVNAVLAMNAGRKPAFFEQAFDWLNATYEFFPYYWGRKARWLDTLTLEDPDPLFEAFLTAGAARVVVPVHPAFSEAILYYQLKGVIWPGGPVPALTPPSNPEVQLYNSYLAELSSVVEAENPDAEVVIDKSDTETWLVKVPTTLIWLQDNNDLPDLEA